MRILRLMLMLVVALAVTNPTAVEAQGRLGRKLKDKISRAAKNKAEDAATDAAVNAAEPTIEKWAEKTLAGFGMLDMLDTTAYESAQHFAAEHGSYSTLPTAVSFVAGEINSESDFERWAEGNLPVDLRLDRRLVESEGQTHIRYRQVHDDVPVMGATYTAHARDGNIWSATGLIYDNIELRTSPSISVPEVVAFLADEWPDFLLSAEPALTVLPDGTGGETVFHLVYDAALFEVSTGLQVAVHIDAHETLVRRVEPLSISLMPAGDGVASDGRTVSFNTQHTDDIETPEDAIEISGVVDGFRLMDTERNLHTMSLAGFTSSSEDYFQPGSDGTASWTGWDVYYPSHDLIEEDNRWESTPEAVDAHWGMTSAYDYFQQVHGRTGFDGNNGYMKGLVNFDANYDNAFYNRQNTIVFGDGSPRITEPDIIAHEFAHAVEHTIVGLKYHGESGSLKEGIADIFMTDFEFHLGGGDWVLPSGDGSVARNYANPKESGAPDTYDGQYWGEYATADDLELGLRDLQQHQNSTILTHWFYLLSEGGEGENDNEDRYDIEPIGREAATDLVYKSLFHLHPTATFEDFRKATVSLAAASHGQCSSEVEQLTNAWNAVGVGAPYCGCFEGSFVWRVENVSSTDRRLGGVGVTEDQLKGSDVALRYFIRGDDIALSYEDEEGKEHVIFSLAGSSVWELKGHPAYTLWQAQVPLLRPPSEPLARKAYLAKRNAARTGNERQYGEYTAYEYKMGESTTSSSAGFNSGFAGNGGQANAVASSYMTDSMVWATEDVCLSFADFGKTRVSFDSGADEIARQSFFGFPLRIRYKDRSAEDVVIDGVVAEEDETGKGEMTVSELREHPVNDYYFSH